MKWEACCFTILNFEKNFHIKVSVLEMLSKVFSSKFRANKLIENKKRVDLDLFNDHTAESANVD